MKSGELEISETTKCLGYERYKIGEINGDELSNGAKELYNIVKEKYSYLKQYNTRGCYSGICRYECRILI